MAEENKQAEAAKTIQKWEVRQFRNGMHGCVLVEGTEGSDKWQEVRSTGSLTHDLDGAEVAQIVDFCNKFHFTVQGMVDECRFSLSRELAYQELDRLQEEQKRNAAQ